jgi:hypothetical protein
MWVYVQIVLASVCWAFVSVLLVCVLASPRYRHIPRLTRFLMLASCILMGVVLWCYVRMNL